MIITFSMEENVADAAGEKSWFPASMLEKANKRGVVAEGSESSKCRLSLAKQLPGNFRLVEMRIWRKSRKI